MSDDSLGAQSPEDEHTHHAEPAEGADEQAPAHDTAGQASADDAPGLAPADSVPDTTAEHAPAEEHETEQQKKARLDAALRKYRATLRNEAETGNGGFSADYYRSQKPPHW